MDEYTVGALGDLISGTKSPRKGKLVLKHAKQSPNKTILSGKGTPKSNQMPKNGSKTSQKRALPDNSNKLKHAKKSKKEILQSDEDGKESEHNEDDQESDLENEQSDDNEGVSGDEEEESGDDESLDEESENNEGKDQVLEGEKSVDAEESDNEDDDNAKEDNSDDDQPEEQSSKPPQEKSMYNDRTIFVGNIKVGTQKKNIVKHFKKYGAIDTVRLRSIGVANPKLGQKLAIQKGTLHPDRETCNAYVRFTKGESAEKAAKEENGKEFYGFHLRVTMADIKAVAHDNKKTLFVGNLSFKAEDEDLWRSFAPCGQIESVRIVRNKQTNVSLGFAYINFQSTDAVQLAMQMGDVTIKGRVLRLKVSDFTAKKEKKPDPSNEKCVFINGFVPGTNRDDIKSAFESCGPVHKVRIIKDKKSGKPTGYGFVTFETAEGAKKALEVKITINKTDVEVLPPRRSLKPTRIDNTGNLPKGKINTPKKSFNPPKGKQPVGKKNYSKPWNKDDKRKSGSSPGKSFQGSQSNAGRVNKKKVNKGDVMKKKMIQKVAPKSPKP